MSAGELKRWNTDSGYGFIKPADGGRDVFLHISALKAAGIEDVHEGDRFEYEAENDPRGRGLRVKKISKIA